MKHIKFCLTTTLCMVILLGWHCRAQDTLVQCYDVGSIMCDGNSNDISYTDCCSQANINTDVYYTHEGQCRLCGPVIVDAFPVITSSLTVTVVTLRWTINPSSLQPIEIQVQHEGEEGSDVAPFPNILPGNERSSRFLGLVDGETYTFEILTRGENNQVSLPYIVRWEAGKSELPTFEDFNQTFSNATTVTARWFLSCYGYRPMTQMVILWREELNEDDPGEQIDPLSFPPGNIAIYNFEDEAPVNGMMFNQTFVNLRPDTRYAILIRGTNELGTSNTFFTIKTEPAPQNQAPGALNHEASVTSSLIIVFISTITTTLLLTFLYH